MAEARMARTGAWTAWPGLVAIALLALQFAGRGYYVWGGYFMQDDFKLLSLGGDSALTLSYLMQEYAGHVWPGNFLMAWWTAQVDATSWGLAATSILLLQGAAGAMMWLVLCRITDDWRIRLPLFVGYLVCPLTMWATQWWASAIGFVPLSFCMLLAVWALLRRIQDDWRPGAAVVVLATFLGLLFLERAFLYAVALGGVAVVMGTGSVIARVLTALRTYWAMWLSLAVLMVGWLAVHLSITTTGIGDGSVDVPVAVRDFLFRSLLPGLAGGPWGGAERLGGALYPTMLASVVGSVLPLVALAALAWRTESSGRLALLVPVLYVLADIVLALGGRATFGSSIGLVPRYVADAVPVFVIGLAFALRDVPDRASRGARGVRRVRPPNAAVVAVVATLVYAAGSVWTTTVIAPMEQASESRAYVANLRASVADHPGAVLYDRSVPEPVMAGLFGDESRVSTVLSGAPERPVFGVMSEDLFVPDETGHLQEVDLWVDRDLNPDVGLGDCGYRVDRGRDPVQVDLAGDGPLEKWWVLRFGYFAGSDTLVTVRLDGEPHSFLAKEGTGQVHLVVDEQAEDLELESWRDHGTVCVTSIEVGMPRQVL